MIEFIIALLTLTFLEIVLGVDNIIFISIVTNKLPEHQRGKGRLIGLSFALIFRITLLISLTLVINHLVTPLFYLFDLGFSVRELVLAAGGLFLLGKSVLEIHHKMEGHAEEIQDKKVASLKRIVLQIVMIDIVFSFDSILTAIGLTDDLPEWEAMAAMITAVITSMIIMLIFSGKISKFINEHPTLEILALSFLILIGFMLILEGVHQEVPKGIIYFGVFFSLAVEIINMRIQRKHKDNEMKLKLNRKVKDEIADNVDQSKTK